MIVKREDPNFPDVLQLKAMNTSFYIKILDCKKTEWKRVISGWIHYVDQEWSRFRKDNEVARLNGTKIGEQMVLSPPLFDLLQKAENYRKKTGGLFSPYLLPQIQYHGYQQTFPFHLVHSQKQTMPTLYKDESAPFEFLQNSGSIKRIADGKVDLGGIAKGYTVQAAVQWLKEIGHVNAGIVDGGGDITVWSNGQKEWKIGVAHPYKESHEIEQIHLKNGSIATSNTVYRSWKQGNQRKHHLLNGKTGLPAESPFIQATVVTDHCLDAEVAAKLCFMTDEPYLDTQFKKIGNIDSCLLVKKTGELVKKMNSR